MRIDFNKLLARGRNLIIAPDNEFLEIRREMQSVSYVNKNFVIPVALIISVFSLIGTAVSNFSSPVKSFIYIGLNVIILFLIILTHSYLSGKAISYLGRNMVQTDPMNNYYALSIYSQLPFFIILAVIKLFPSLAFLIILAFYSGYIFKKGCNSLIKIPADRQLQFTLLSMLIIISVFILTSELFTMLYSEIL